MRSIPRPAAEGLDPLKAGWFPGGFVRRSPSQRVMREKQRLRFKEIALASLLVSAGLFATSIYGFLQTTAGQGSDYAQLAMEEYLLTIITYQLRVIPAYLIVALAGALILYPALRWLRWRPSRLRWIWVLLTSGVGLGALYGLSLGVFFRKSPGLLDSTARIVSKVAPEADLYWVYRWRVLDGAALGFWAFAAFAAIFYCWRWFKATRAARGPRKLALLTLAGALLLGLGWLSSPPPPPPQGEDSARPMNLLIIGSDSWRWDRVGVHGYHRQDITPNIDAFAREAISLENLHVSTASTLESWMSIMSSRFPPDHGVRYMYINKKQAEAASKIEGLLPRMLKKDGFYTSVVSNWAGNNFKLVDHGFEHNLASDTQNFKAFIMEATIWTHIIFPLYFSNTLGEILLPEVKRITKYLRPNAMVDKMMGQIDNATNNHQPFFGLLFFSSTHLPYTASYPFNVKYVDPNYKGIHKYQIDVTVHDLITTGFKPDLPPETIAHIQNLYDGTVSEFDHYVGMVIEELKRRDLYERTVIVVTTDHGEDLYDPGSTLGHGTNFFGGDQSTRIPFFIRVPGLARGGAKVEAMTRSVDLAPTFASLLKLAPHPSWIGVDLGGLLRGDVLDLDLPIFAETCYMFFPKSKALVDLTAAEREDILDSSGAKDTLKVDKDFNNNMTLRPELHDMVLSTKDRMVRTRRWKLLHIPGRRAPIYRLYDMQADPKQTVDLSSQDLPVQPALIQLLDEYWAGRGGAQRWPAALDAASVSR